MHADIVARPFLKWVGGKQALSAQLLECFPAEFDRYYEPFLGGGSVFFGLSPQNAVLADQNVWLVDTYEAVRKDWPRVAGILDAHENSKSEYLRLRRIQPDSVDLFERAALFVYLNKTCFRGLFRVNRKGMFNVPYGAYTRRYYDPRILEEAATLLRRATLVRGDFEGVVESAGSRDFIYFDPPYFKLGGYSDFNRYTSGKFHAEDHLRLATVCRELDKRGVRWALSNSDTAFVRRTFKGFRQCVLQARREINLNSRLRTVPELLIRNY